MSLPVISSSERRAAFVIGTVGGGAIEHNRVFGKAVGRDVPAYVPCFRCPVSTARLRAYVRFDMSVKMLPARHINM
jgi:hypothetical protein